MSEPMEKTAKELLHDIDSTMYPKGLFHWNYSTAEYDFITDYIRKLGEINNSRVSTQIERTRQKLSDLQRATDEIYGVIKKNVNLDFARQDFYVTLHDLRGRGCFGIVDSW